MIPKPAVIGGLLLKPEASYNAGGAVAAATDGVQLSELATATLDWADKGERDMAIGSASHERRGAPSGRFVTIPVKTLFRGPGAVLSASVTPQDIHALMRISGHSATLLATGGAEKYTYAPVSDAYASGVGELYGYKQKYGFQGAFADLKIAAAAGGFVSIDAAISALVTADFSDVSTPVITYPYQAIQRPKFENIALTIGSFASAKVVGIDFATNWEIVPTLDANSGTHGGFSMIRRKPTLNLNILMSSLTTTPFHAVGGIDPYNLWRVGTEIALGFTVGAVQYNKLEFTGPKCQVVSVAESADAGKGTWAIGLQLNPSTPTANDDYAWIVK